jgi:hypothetical protein
MKTLLRLFLIALLPLFGAISTAFAQGPTISSTLAGAEDVTINEPVEFTISTTKGNAADGTTVKARMVLLGDLVEEQSESIELEYLETSTDPDEWRTLSVSPEGVVEFGPAT